MVQHPFPVQAVVHQFQPVQQVEQELGLTLTYRVRQVQPVEATEITGQFDSASLVGFAERLDFPSSPL